MSRDEVVRHLRYELSYNTQFDDKDKEAIKEAIRLLEEGKCGKQ